MQIQACIALCEQRCMPVEVHIEASIWEAVEVHAYIGMHLAAASHSRGACI